ncbi:MULTISPECIES: hypothetical protein [Streptomyces]|jgi:hypothetical protein|uniref:Uncharacterized protein n=2 Tax=Streptomyces TaxID=1883 RepID=A0A7W7XF89_9ACTN|nr:hypothetical protein [Streptomyces nymphaeiformis]MBB4984933.1 hypothetical protein [Streptomyces nymphaeiformis]
MNMRHVRAIAVFGIAVVALTGARGSHGGSCGGGHSSGSHSSGSNHGDDHDGTSGGSSTGSVSGSTGSADKAIRDITIDACKYDPAKKNLVAKVTIKNDNLLDYDYDVTMKFNGETGSGVVPATVRTTAIAVAAGASESVDMTTPYPGTGDASEYTECWVTKASRS